ncbi:predicted protein [Lichtheimia corymbifera JMRC:FSU:9682]|uniref:Choice-of-anchor A domain-containing protein n=1 Tax=Lichtheimia corymbifera JMRC:FSU:9682 TaxID=1263082 RepID=A0A068SFE7_9FUNG|nr:predicted protein [Lichtheimia corymbifera JMRC:FSU:9682]
MKFLGVTIYAAAFLATIHAFPGHYKHRGSDGGWRHYHKGKKHPHKEEIHYQVVTPTNTAGSAVPTIKLPNPALEEIGYVCPIGNATQFGQEVLTHFSGIFYNDFTTGGTGQDILGPLAVGGNFHAPNYIVNANHDINCAADETSSFGSVGLVVGGDSTTSNTHLRGDNLIAGNGDAGQYDQQLAGCRVYTDEGTGHFDFQRSYSDADTLSRTMASLSADSVLSEGGAVTKSATVDNAPFRVFKMNTCDGSCPTTEVLSYPDEMLFGNGNWNGPSGDVPTSDETVIINIPVTSGTTIDLRSNAPSQGFDSCRIIYNFYPVDEQGNYDANGEFTLDRETGSQLEGLVLAPHAHIRDGNTGNFAGIVIGNDYGWLDQSAGVEIHDWAAAGCPGFQGCIPLNPDTGTCTPSTTTRTQTVPTTTTTTEEDTTTKYVGEATVTDFETTTTTVRETKGVTFLPTTETVTVTYTKEKDHHKDDHKDDHKDEDWITEDKGGGEAEVVETEKGDDEWTKGPDWDKEDEWTKGGDETWTKGGDDEWTKGGDDEWRDYDEDSW